MGGPSDRFPSTHWSVLKNAGNLSSPDAVAAREAVCRIYWKPVYAFIRSHNVLPGEDPKDLTQEFLIEILEGNFLGRYVPQKGAFRTYLKGAVRFFLMECRNKSLTLKRGGGRKMIRMAEDETHRLDVLLADRTEDPEAIYDEIWARSLMDDAVAALENEMVQAGKTVWFRAFRRYDLETGPDEELTYGKVSQELNVSESDVGNYLAYCRKRLRKLVVDRVTHTVDHPGDIRAELDRILSHFRVRPA